MKLPADKILSALPVAGSAFDAALRYVRDDQRARYGLAEPVTVVLDGDGIGDAFFAGPNGGRQVSVGGGVLVIDPISRNRVRLTANPFAPETENWNGPDVLPNNRYRTMLASLFHDLIWKYADEIAAALGCEGIDVLRWGNGILYALWVYASPYTRWGRFEAWWAWRTCEFAAPVYHRVKRRLRLSAFVALAAGAASCAGCKGPPDWRVVEIDGTNAVVEAMQEYGDGLGWLRAGEESDDGR